MKVIPQKAGSDSEASARALATEQPSRAWLFAEEERQHARRSRGFRKSKVEAYKKKNLHHGLKRVVQILPKKVGSEPKPSCARLQANRRRERDLFRRGGARVLREGYPAKSW